MSLFSRKERSIPEGWKVLESEEQMRQAIRSSKEKPVAFFKHSTRCGVSGMVLSTLEKAWDIGSDELDMFYLDLLAKRDISDLLASVSQVHHESPQLILIRDGMVVYHASHHEISAEALRLALKG